MNEPQRDAAEVPEKVYGFRLAQWTEGEETYGPGPWTFITDPSELDKIRAAGYEVVEWTR